MSWYDKVVVPADILKSKGETTINPKVRYGGKKKKVKKGPRPSLSNTRCCGKVSNHTYKGTTYCNNCHRSVGQQAAQ